MGMTIHYEFKGEDDPALARKQVAGLRQRALQLPFEHVGEIQVFAGEGFVGSDKLEFLATDGNAIQPTEVIAFAAQPGEGCETAWFGLRRHEGYSWRSYCKTCYAVTALDFLRCHIVVIKMLDFAAEMGLLRSVDDEGEYWEHRDWMKLLQNNGRWDELPSPRETVAKQLRAWFGPVSRPVNWKQYVAEEE